MADPTQWLSAEFLEKHAPGFVVGALFALAVAFRVLKSGILVFGDKAKLIKENAVLEVKCANLRKELKETKEEMAALRAAQPQ